MDKQEFLKGLKEALQGEINPNEINEHLRYYDDYIVNEVRNGKSEQEILMILGDPRLIARTIIETSPSAGGSAEEYYESGAYEKAEQTSENNMKGGFYTGSWYGRLIAVCIVILIVLFIIGLVTSVVSFLLPIAIPVLLILFVISLLRGSGR